MSCSIIQTIDSKECVGNSLVKINTNFTELETAVCALQTATSNIPIGGVIMYQGNSSDFDENGRGKIETDVYLYGLCNGNTYNDIVSPDLRNRFVAGAGGGYTLNERGGLSAVKLVLSNIPSHNHKFKGNTQTISDGIGGEGGYKNDDNGTKEEETAYRGGDANGNTVAVKTLPPYHALYYIIKIA